MVSVIVPIYKAEKTLPACVESILAQTYTDFELLLIDDGSPDSCGKLCDEYAQRDSRIRVFHQENGGVSRARNCGMDNMRGEYFVCVDSDDVVEPCYLEDLVTTQENHPEFGHVLCGFYCVSRKRSYVLTEEEPLSAVDRKDYMRLSDCVLVQGPCLHLYRAKIVNEHNIRMREDLCLAEDSMFNLDYLDALEKTAIGVINKPNYVYQDEDGSSLYHRYNKNQLENSRMVNARLKECLTGWGVCDDDSRARYNDSVLFSYIAVLENTMSELNPMSKQEKIAYNNSVMKEKDFVEALKNSRTFNNQKLKEAFLSGDYKRVLAINRLSKIKKTVFDLLKTV